MAQRKINKKCKNSSIQIASQINAKWNCTKLQLLTTIEISALCVVVWLFGVDEMFFFGRSPMNLTLKSMPTTFETSYY